MIHPPQSRTDAFLPAPAALTLLACLGLACTMSGCGLWAPKGEPEWAVFTGQALTSDEPTTATLVARNPAFGLLTTEAFRTTRFEARARASLPAVRATEAQRAAFATAEARRAALRSLGESVLVHQPSGSSKNLALVFEAAEVDRAALERTLEDGSEVTFQRVPETESVEAKAVITGAVISNRLTDASLNRLREEARQLAGASSPEERTARAEEAALTLAREQALREVMAIQTNLGTMAQLAEQHPKMADEIQAWIHETEPEPFKHSEQGVCEAAIRLDMRKPFEIIQHYAKPPKAAEGKKKREEESPKQPSTENPEASDSPLPLPPPPANGARPEGHGS